MIAPDEVDKHAASTDQRQHQPSSADSLGLSEIVCGQRMPTFSPTPNARPSTQTQPYDDIDEVEYQDDLPELYDDVNNIGRTTVAEDSLVGTSGEALSYSTTQTRGVDVNSVDAREERSHNDQDDIIPSTFLGRMPKSGSHPDVEEESEQEPVEEELLERHMGSISPEVESEDNDDTRNRKQVPSSPSTLSQKSATSRHNIFQTSHDIAKTGRMKTYGKQGRGRERPSLPDHVKRQLDKDTLDLVSQTPSVQQVFLCIEIPSVPESTESQSKVAMNAKSKALRSKPNAERKRVSEGSSKKEPKSPSPPPPPPQRAVRRPTDRKRNQTDTQRRSSRRAAPRHPGVHYEKEISDYDDNIEEDERKSEDKSNSDELEVAGVSPSSILRPIRTHLLPPKKRIRAQETFQNDSLSSSQEQQRRPGPRVLHDSDSDGEQVLHNVRKRRNNGNRLSSTGPSPPTEEQEQEYEQEQEQDQDVQQSPSPPSPRPDEEYDSSRPQSDSAERRDGEDQEQGLDRRWEVTKLQKVWKEHGIRWPLRQGQGEEEYNAYFVFGSALPLPK
ncbi:hypothetical protein EC991_001856 [Linnemannia zychae]|nr:hypothetical protein EC991_001856 [Linnemannia zychae]